MRSQTEIIDELKLFWDVKEFAFEALCVEIQGKQKFINLRKANNGDLLILPDGRKVSVNIPSGNYITGRNYKIKCILAAEKFRSDKGIEYLLWLDKREIPELLAEEPRTIVREIYNDFTTAKARLRETLEGALKRITSDINKKPETFIYELLQNANDYPDKATGLVAVIFQILPNYLLLTHNGEPFSDSNVDAICKANAGDKEFDRSKIGYKGIGFKSVFKLSDYVLLRTGGYCFRFDEHYHLKKGIKTFWQIIPIWTEEPEIPVSLQNEAFLNSSVSIAIRPKENAVSMEDIERVFTGVFADERILLFLRNISSVSFTGTSSKFDLGKQSSGWELSTLKPVSVPQKMRDLLNKKIDADDVVPEKYRNIEETEITFASQTEDGNLQAVNNSKIYVYLPTEVQLGFPFLINGDFIPDGGRQLIHGDLDWNLFLFKEAGKAYISWLKDLWVKFCNSSIVNLIPDFENLLDEAKGDHYTFIEMFHEGVLEALEDTAFIPDINGKQAVLSDFLIDSTGLSKLLGEEKFKEITGRNFPIMDAAFAEGQILKWVEENGLGSIFGFNDLKEILSEDSFREWLSVPENNLTFLCAYQYNGLTDSEVILDSAGNLQPGDKIYLNLGGNEELLDWLDIPVLHPYIAENFKNSSLPILEFEPVTFIEDFILPNNSEIDEKIEEKENSKKFYQFLFKHHQSLNDNLVSEEKLGWFQFINAFEEVAPRLISSAGYNIYFTNSIIKGLIEKNALPSDFFELLDPEWYSIKGEKGVNFWKKFQVNDVSAGNWKPFLEREIIGKESNIQKHFTSLVQTDPEGAISANGQLWMSLHSLKDKIPGNDWKALCTDIEKLPVVTTGGELRSLADTYLSSVYTENKALELLADRFVEIEVDFISDGYILDTSLTPRKWRNLFQDFNAKSNEKQLLQDYIIPELSSLTEEEIVPTTRLIFENGITENLTDLRVKTTSGNYLPVAQTLVGKPYNEADYWDNTIPSISLNHFISGDYLTGNNPEKWEKFFISCGAKPVKNQLELISLKIEEAISLKNLNEVTDEKKEFSINIVKDLIALHNQKILVEDHYSTLGILPLLGKSLKNDFYFFPAKILWLGSGFKPRFDLEYALKEEDSNEYFVDELYINDDVSSKKAKEFFIKIGAYEDFEVRHIERKQRTDAPVKYISTIDKSNISIANNSQSYGGKYINQHYISPWKYILYIDYLKHPKISFSFWKKFNSNKNFREQILEGSPYHWYVGNVTEVLNPILWWLQTNPCLPVGDGSTCIPTSNAVSFTFRQFSNDHSTASGINFEDLKFGELMIEELLGIKYKPDLATVLDTISFIKDYEKLRQLGFWHKLKEILLDENLLLSPEDLTALESFKLKGFLPNQYKKHTKIQNLYYLQAGLKLGLGYHPNLLLKELEEIAPLLGLRELNEEDFNPTFHNSIEDIEFKSRLIRHLGFVALAESEENWKTLRVEYQKAINPILFHTVSEIEFSFIEINPPIQNTEKTFYAQGENVFYVGNWNGTYSNELFKYLHKILDLKISKKTFTDLILFEIPQIIQLFTKKKISVPKQLQPPTEVKPSPSETIVKEKETDYDIKSETPDRSPELNSGISETAIKELESLLGKNLGTNEKENANLIALFRCIKYCQKNYYQVNTSSNSIDEAIELRFIKATMTSGEKVNVMFRSARGKLMHLNYSAWFDLDKTNTWLFVITGNSEDDFMLFKSQEDLAEASGDAWVMKVGGEEKLEDLSKLISGKYSIEGNQFDARVQFLIRLGTQEYQSIFEKLPQIGSEW